MKLIKDKYFKMIFRSKDKDIRRFIIRFLEENLKIKIKDYNVEPESILKIKENSITQSIDVNILLDTGERILIEMQLNPRHKYFLHRVFNEAGSSFFNQLQTGAKFNELRKHYIIVFTPSINTRERKTLISGCTKTDFLFNEKREFEHIKYFLFQLNNTDDNSIINVSKYTIDFLESLQKPKCETSDFEEIVNFGKALKNMGLYYDDIYEIKKVVRQMYENSIIDEAKTEAREEGQKEERINIVLSMKSKGLSDKEISELTNISIEKVNAIK